MLKLLETGKKYTVAELALKIEVSPRMIKTYKAKLEKAGIYIDTISGIYGGYVYNRKTNYNVSFNLRDVGSLEKIIPLIDPNTRDALERLLEKIKTIVIYSDYSDNKEKNDQETKIKYNIISKAINNNDNLELIYKKKK